MNGVTHKERSLHVVVTQEHIDRGQRNSAYCHPIAYAVADAMEKREILLGRDATKTKYYVREWDSSKDRAGKMWLPQSENELTQTYDNGGAMSPHEFTITWQEETLCMTSSGSLNH